MFAAKGVKKNSCSTDVVYGLFHCHLSRYKLPFSPDEFRVAPLGYAGTATGMMFVDVWTRCTARISWKA